MGLTSILAGNTALAIIILVWSLAMLYVIYKDAQARYAQPRLLLAGLALTALFLPPFGLVVGVVVYWLFRPKGRLIPCPHCAGRCVHNLLVCPRCGGTLAR